jgi:pimeloyl-ACP methyl ester carboxylesterase
MSWHQIIRDGAKLSGIDTGEGRAVVFQHGLGGDEAQVSAHFPDEGFRRQTLECRAQGRSEPGDPARFSIQAFADDVLAFADARGVKRFAVGGISMGAAIALNIAVRHPDRVTALILARPAWAWDKAPENMRPLSEVAEYLVDGGKEAFEKSALGQRLAKDAPDNLASMLGFFDRPDLVTTARLLSAIAADGPGVTKEQAAAVNVPALIIGNGLDLVHPMPMAKEIARRIPGARYVEIAPKSLDKEKHAAEFRQAVLEFLSGEQFSTLGAAPHPPLAGRKRPEGG